MIKKMFSTKSKKWMMAAGIRAVRTFAQTLGSFIVIGASVGEINWLYALSVSVVALASSLVTSLAGLPEVKG